ESNLPSPPLVWSNENEISERLGRNSKKYNTQLKIVRKSTLSLMSHLQEHHDII
ncbi:22868_t:CDS:2, partial [Cetraspora pellucida]